MKKSKALFLCHQRKNLPFYKGVAFCKRYLKKVTDLSASGDTTDFLMKKPRTSIVLKSNFIEQKVSPRISLFTAFVLVCWMSLFSTSMHAQKIPSMDTEVLKRTSIIKGIVTDTSGSKLPFVSVVLKNKEGIELGTYTNLDGEYSIDLPSDFAQSGDSLELNLRCIGFTEMNIRGIIYQEREILNATLSQNKLLFTSCPNQVCWLLFPKLNMEEPQLKKAEGEDLDVLLGRVRR